MRGEEADPIAKDENIKIAEGLQESLRETEEKPAFCKYHSKHAKLFPELYRSDVSIHPSYTGLKSLPYRVICRNRVQRIKRQATRQLNREIAHFTMIQMFALDGVRIDRVFSVGMSPKMLIVPDPLTDKERRHLNELLRSP